MALSSSSKYDCIVIGAGIQGSFTAYHLAKSGKKTLLLEQNWSTFPKCWLPLAVTVHVRSKVYFFGTVGTLSLETSFCGAGTRQQVEVTKPNLLDKHLAGHVTTPLLQPGCKTGEATLLPQFSRPNLEISQFPLPHSRGSSHGQTRIIRRAYPEDFYTDMMEECYQLWAEVERESETKLYRKTGLLVLANAGNHAFEVVCENMKQRQIPWESLSQATFKMRYPGFSIKPGEEVCNDINGGVLYADKSLRAVQGLFQLMGGVIHDGEKVTHIEPGPVVIVSTTSSTYEAEKLVITVGPWAKKVLSPLGLQLPLKTLRINVCYWREKNPGDSGILQNLPCFLGMQLNGDQRDVYGLQSQEYPGLIKICYHHGNEAEPEERDLQVKDPKIPDIQILRSFISNYLPGLHPEPVVVEQCMYTSTPDANFILDHHPLHKNIVIGAGFSGHGFKLSPVVGKILSELCIGTKSTYDLKPFQIARFQNQ